MNISKNKILLGLITLLVIIGAFLWYFAFFSIDKETAKSTVRSESSTTEQPNSDSKFASLQGDEFDEAYLADMFAHHEGAVNMAEQAQSVTAHQEIQILANDITMSQSQEMIKMQKWQQDWGFDTTSSGGHLSHGGSAMQMGGDMVEMMNTLKDLKGESFDKEFLKQMIIHHQQAIEMSEFADANASRQEIKDLALEVISTQTKEIEKMKLWQTSWGY